MKIYIATINAKRMTPNGQDIKVTERICFTSNRSATAEQYLAYNYDLQEEYLGGKMLNGSNEVTVETLDATFDNYDELSDFCDCNSDDIVALVKHTGMVVDSGERFHIIP